MNNKLDGMSMNLENANMEKLKTVFPECFNEGTLDIDKLLSLCGEYIDNDFEKYKFEWKGKSECLRLAQKRSTGTLRPCKDESVNFDDTKNLYIEGDNLEVLKLLQTAYYNKVKMIYIDPPYNTGNDFVYEDDFADPMARYKEITEQTTKSNPETMGRFHTNWLNMMYPRLRLAANLLTDDGVIFISIDDNEVFNLKKVCDEVFGEENYVAQIPWRKRTAKSDVPFGVSQDYEWILCYAKSDEFVACLEGGTRKYFESDDLPGRPWRIHDLTTQRSALERPNSNFTMVNPKTGTEYPANPNRTWAVTKETFEQYYAENRIVFPDDYDFLNISKPAFRYFKEDDMAKAGDKFGFIPVSTKLPDDIGMTQDGTKEIIDLFENKVFGFPKPIAILKYLIKAATITTANDNDIILDFFSGSATTAHAVMQLNIEDGGNRRFICVQLPEKVRYQVFSVFANMFGPADNFVSIFCGGLSQIMMVCLLLLFGYLAWGHFRKLHLLIFAVYALMVLLGIWNDFDWLSIAIGLGGVLINIYAMMGMSEEEHLSALEGYPEFQAPLQLSKDDFVKPAAKPDAPDRDVKYIAAQKERAKREREKADAALAQSLAAKQPEQKAEASKATPIADEADSLHTLFDPVKDTALFAPKEENTKENAHDTSRN